MTSEKVILEVGKVYVVDGSYGSYVKCLECWPEWDGTIDAAMQNILSGWTFLAHDVRMTDNEKIFWAYGTKGRFETVVD